MSADDHQVGGNHYKALDPSQEHWNLVAAYGWDYFTAQTIKYMMRWRKKNGVQDLRKARHFLDKLIELESAIENEREDSKLYGPSKAYTNQD